MIHGEIDLLPAQNVLWETDRYSVMFASAQQIPNLLYDIGRLRELTFRGAGEGTGRSVDLDRFDLYYTHLFLWNKEKRELVGSYRIAPVDRVIERFGTKGLYTSTLFTYKETFFEHMRDAVELGRSFVRPEYQKSYSPLLVTLERDRAFHRTQPAVSDPLRGRNHQRNVQSRLPAAHRRLPQGEELCTASCPHGKTENGDAPGAQAFR